MYHAQIQPTMCAWCAQSFIPKHHEQTECSIMCAIAVVKAERGIDFSPAYSMVRIATELIG